MRTVSWILPVFLLLSACATVEVGRAFDLAAFARVSILQIKFDPRGVIRAYNWSGERRQP